MTRAQEQAIERLVNKFVGFYGFPEEKEVKRKYVKEYDGGTVYVQLTVGYIGDEGTMQEVICRNSLDVCIGKKGGYFKYSDSKSHYRRTFRTVVDVICKCQWR